MNAIKRKLTALGVVAALTAGGYVGYRTIDNVQFARAQEKVEATREQLSKVEDLATVFRDVGKTLEPSVVSINVTKHVKGMRGIPFDHGMLRRFFPDQDGDGQPDVPEGFGDEGSMEQVGTGSGVIIESADGTGYILTNNHVAGGAETMEITLSDGRKIRNGKLLGADAKTDLAVVKISADHLIAAKWGDSETLQKGDWVLAFGSPFGYVGSMTHGIISAINRTNVGILSPGGYEDFIQVDAPINPGNSGGPLVNIHGEVIGINTAIASRSGGFQGIGFAIPSNLAKFVYGNLKDKGKVTRGWLGIGIRDVSEDPDLAKNAFGYEGSTGVIVEEVRPGTPAVGELKRGDIITKLNGKPIPNTLELRNAIAATAPGTEVTVGVVRDGKNEDVKFKVGEQPEDVLASSRMRGNRGGGDDTVNTEAMSNVGIEVTDLTSDRADKMGLNGVKGALITSVEPRSPAARASIFPGEVITEINKKPVKSAADAKEMLNKANLEKGVTLYLTNKDTSRFAFLRVPKDQ